MVRKYSTWLNIGNFNLLKGYLTLVKSKNC